MKVPVFDATRQYGEMRSQILPVLDEVMTKGHFILGDHVRQLEAEVAQYTGVNYGIGVANGSDAIHLALMALEIGADDEVIVPAFTFFATAGAVARTGATPVFVDVDPATFTIDVLSIEQVITPRTKAIIPVHLYGQAAPMERLMALAKQYGIRVVEDTAQAIGAKHHGKDVCSFGDLGTLSFFPTKNLGAFGDGGMVLTQDEALAARLRMLRVHGARTKYVHELPGYNSRLDEMQAVVLRLKLQRLAAWTKARQTIAQRYDRLITEAGLHEWVTTPHTAPGNVHVFHQYTLKVAGRDELRKYLSEHGVETAVYYPGPLHLQKVFEGFGYTVGSLPVSERLCYEALSLPMFPELQANEQEYVVEQIVQFYRGGKP